MSNIIREQTITGMIWSFIERFGSMILQFIANIILARLLTPDDFGLIGMIMVFIAISNTIVDSGFSAALIQKKEVTQEDYSTVFYVNILLALLLFSILYFTAPLIADFYQQQELINLLRVLGFVLILNSFNIIQSTQLIRIINFKRMAKINVFATFLSCILGIALALSGFGVWSLIVQMLSIAFFKSVFLWIWNTWRPTLLISSKSLKNLFGFGSKLLFSSLLDTLYTNLQLLIVGKLFSVRDLGFYTQASKLVEVPVNTLSGVVTQVTFPIFSRLQDDTVKMKNGVQKSLKALVYVNFPLMVLLIIIAKPLFILLFTEKWNEAIPYFQILCLPGMILTFHITNLNVLKAIGRTDIYFNLEIAKKIIGVISIIIGIQFGIIGMLISFVIASYISLGLNAYFSGKVINYGIIEQFKDVFFTFILAITVGVLTYFIVDCFSMYYVFKLFSLIIVYTVLYISTSKFMHLDAFDLFITIAKEKIFKRNKFLK